MRIVWIKVGGLWPLNTGGRLRSFHIVSELSRRNRLTVLTTHDPGETSQELALQLPNCERVVSVPYSIPKHTTPRFAKALVSSWFTPYPVDVWKCRVPELRRAASELMAVGDAFDVCVVDFLAAMSNIPARIRVPTVFFAHNVEHIIWKRLATIAGRSPRRPALELEWRKMRRIEARACESATLTVAVSENDAGLLRGMAPRATVRSIPTGVDTDYFSPAGSDEIDATLVFTGAMDWYPNEDAVVDFITAILPRIRAAEPAVSIVVVGRNPTPRLRRLAAQAGVTVTGTVDDVRPHVARAAVYVVPLRIGGGTRLKIFEALAMSKAVVSTTIGVEGLPLLAGEHFLRADDPADFAGAVVTLLRDPVRRKSLGAAGRHLVEEFYAWPQVASAFEARCREAMAGPDAD
jgi:polysaccharide biosynthesis protein PslH